jgi:hypothetical protein
LLFLLIILLWILLRILLHHVAADGNSENTSKILLRQRVELMRKRWKS